MGHRKNIKYSLAISQILIAMFCHFNTAQANPEQQLETQVSCADNFDPIAAVLDSLVNQNYIVRLNSSIGNNSSVDNFQNQEIPSYTDDVYQKRIAKIPTPIPLAYNEEVKKYIEMYAQKKRGLTERVMGLANFYFPLYEQVLDQQGLPLEFKYLSIVESALNPMAVSRMGATGLWQFMLGTGRLYNLKINSLVDERRDPLKSTQAACQYFKEMYSIYNDWLLVIAAYNCGAGNVNRAIARSGGKKTFWEIDQYLPRETRGYVPAFIAVTYLMNYSSEHNLVAVPPLISYFEADTVMVDQKISFREISDAINVPVELISYLNPVYKRGIIPNSEEPQVLRLPSNKINSFISGLEGIFNQEAEQSASMLASMESSMSDMGSYSVKKICHVKHGERLQTIAMRYNCSVDDLKQWNKLKNSKLVTGQKLTVYVYSNKKKDSKRTAVLPAAKKSGLSNGQALVRNNANPGRSTATLTSRQAGQNAEQTFGRTRETKNLKTIYHIVQPGDTLWKIAQRYDGATVEMIKEINQLQSNDLKVGTKLRVPVAG